MLAKSQVWPEKGTKVFISGRVQGKEFINHKSEVYRKTELVASEMIAFDKRKELNVEE